jgi:8-oxo-dGTP diphosphatase
MIDPHPNDPLAYQEWIDQLEQKWLAGSIPDPQAVAIILLNDNGEVLLQLRDSNPEISFACCWTLLGGVVGSAETPDDAARRELAEEAGISIHLSHWKVYRRKSEGRKFLIEQHVYTGRTQHDVGEMVLGEGQALRFFERQELSTLAIAYGFESLLAEFFHQFRETGS